MKGDLSAPLVFQFVLNTLKAFHTEHKLKYPHCILEEQTLKPSISLTLQTLKTPTTSTTPTTLRAGLGANYPLEFDPNTSAGEIWEASVMDLFGPRFDWQTSVRKHKVVLKARL